MLGLAGLPLGEQFTFLDPAEAAPAAAVGRLIQAAYDDPAALAELAATCDVATFEFEQVPAAGIDRLVDAGLEVRPGARPLAVAQDRLEEKRLFERLGIAVPRFAPVDSAGDLAAALADFGAPAILKTRGGGYDGKGQLPVAADDDPGAAVAELGGVRLIVEERVSFDRELSVIAVRDPHGDVLAYPLIENTHRAGILHMSRAPAPFVGVDLQRRAEAHARRVLEELDYVGVLAIELFQVGGDLLGNEMAPRVHNSGHWTIEGAETGQFENHIRAITERPLGRTDARGESVMLNLIGDVPDPSALLRLGGHLHLYGKSPRPGRKLGHVTFTDTDPARLEGRVAKAARVIAR
jgi:5-(carboxyamino)imidazole ribonucleotide synthase